MPAGDGPLARLLREDALEMAFQPIASLQDGSLYAHEALVRGPANMPLRSPDALFAAARREGLSDALELACVELALRRWGARAEPGRLCINISANVLMKAVSTRSVREWLAYVDALALQPRMLCLEITEHDLVDDVDAFVAAAGDIQSAGISFALDDFGNGRSSLRLWSELRPDIVKVDKYFVDGIASKARNVQTVRALMQIAEVFGTTLVAEGVERSDDLRVLRELGIPLGQGYLLGRPSREPASCIADDAARVIDDGRVAVIPALRTAASPRRVQMMNIVDADPLRSDATNDGVAESFFRHPAWPALAVVDDGRPIAIIERHQFLDRYAKAFFKELYGRKSCMAFANTAPRMLERDQDVGELVGILTAADQRYLTDGFIVTENGRYIGIGTADQLVRNVTEHRIEAARHANPLTFLPGNIPITEHIDRLLRRGRSFVTCYADLRDFKPFNDRYGYWRGDEMIKLVAQTMLAHCDAQRDFIGHVGGDDFVLVFQDDGWRPRCEAIVAEFASRAIELYDDESRRAGGIHADDRHGVARFFPIVRLYMGAVRSDGRLFDHAEAVASAAAGAKNTAKQRCLGIWLAGDDADAVAASPSALHASAGLLVDLADVRGGRHAKQTANPPALLPR